MRKTGCFLVSFDFSENGDIGVLIVGEQKDNQVNIINAFQEEAHDIYLKLAPKVLPLMDTRFTGKPGDLIPNVLADDAREKLLKYICVPTNMLKGSGYNGRP